MRYIYIKRKGPNTGPRGMLSNLVQSLYFSSGQSDQSNSTQSVQRCI